MLHSFHLIEMSALQQQQPFNVKALKALHHNKCLCKNDQFVPIIKALKTLKKEEIRIKSKRSEIKLAQ